jgi:hypothetical protein
VQRFELEDKREFVAAVPALAPAPEFIADNVLGKTGCNI